MKVVSLDWLCTDYMIDFGTKKLQLDIKTFGFVNVVGLMVTMVASLQITWKKCLVVFLEYLSVRCHFSWGV